MKRFAPLCHHSPCFNCSHWSCQRLVLSHLVPQTRNLGTTVSPPASLSVAPYSKSCWNLSSPRCTRSQDTGASGQGEAGAGSLGLQARALLHPADTRCAASLGVSDAESLWARPARGRPGGTGALSSSLSACRHAPALTGTLPRGSRNPSLATAADDERDGPSREPQAVVDTNSGKPSSCTLRAEPRQSPEALRAPHFHAGLLSPFRRDEPRLSRHSPGVGWGLLTGSFGPHCRSSASRRHEARRPLD